MKWRLCLVWFQLTIISLPGTTATKTAFAKTSCTKAKEETGIVSLLDRLVSPLALRLRMSVNSQRQESLFEDI